MWLDCQIIGRSEHLPQTILRGGLECMTSHVTAVGTLDKGNSMDPTSTSVIRHIHAVHLPYAIYRTPYAEVCETWLNGISSDRDF